MALLVAMKFQLIDIFDFKCRLTLEMAGSTMHSLFDRFKYFNALKLTKDSVAIFFCEQGVANLFQK